MAEVTWTDEAHKWLKQVHDHIAAGSPQAAMRVVEGIYRRVGLILDGRHLRNDRQAQSWVADLMKRVAEKEDLMVSQQGCEPPQEDEYLWELWRAKDVLARNSVIEKVYECGWSKLG